MEGLPTFRHGNQLIVLPSIPIDHPYRHLLKSYVFHPGCGMTFRKSPLQNYLMEIDNPILRSENGVTEVAYPIFMSENGVMEVANPILTIKIGIMEVVIQRVRGHGSRERKFTTQRKVLEIANPIFDIKMRFWKSPSLFLPP